MYQQSLVINNYYELCDFVKSIKNNYNLDGDTIELVDMLIYRWFSQKGVRALDSCYHIFNKKLQEDEGIKIRVENGMILADWEQ